MNFGVFIAFCGFTATELASFTLACGFWCVSPLGALSRLGRVKMGGGRQKPSSKPRSGDIIEAMKSIHPDPTMNW